MQKKLESVYKANPLSARQQLSPLATPEMRKLAEKMKFASGLKQVITN